MADVDREEKLRAAKLKLKKFQEQKQLRQQGGVAAAADAPPPAATAVPPMTVESAEVTPSGTTAAPEAVPPATSMAQPQPDFLSSFTVAQPAPAPAPEVVVAPAPAPAAVPSQTFTFTPDTPASAFPTLQSYFQSQAAQFADEAFTSSPAGEPVPMPVSTNPGPTETAPPSVDIIPTEEEEASASVGTYFSPEPSAPALEAPTPAPASAPAPATESPETSAELSVPLTTAAFVVSQDVTPAVEVHPPEPAAVVGAEVKTEVSSLEQLTAQINGVLSSPHLDEAADDQQVLQGAKIAELEKRNQELSGSLQQHATALQQYETYCQSLGSQLLEAQQKLEKERSEKDNLLLVETNKLKGELEAHRESLNMIVTEKSDFEAKWKHADKSLQEKEAELLQLQGVVQQLQETAPAGQSHHSAEAEAERHRLELDLSKSGERLQALQLSSDEQKQDAEELRSKLAAKERETDDLKLQLTEKAAKLEMTELNLAQLRTAAASATVSASAADESASLAAQQAEKESAAAAEISGLKSKVEEFEQREAKLTEYIQQASLDREQIIKQYTDYSQQLTGQIEGVTQQLNDKLRENDALVTREAEMVAHVEQLEAQLQQLIQSSKQQQQQLLQQRQQSPSPSSSQQQQQQHLPSTVDKHEAEVLRQKAAEMDKKLTTALTDRDDLQERLQAQDDNIQTLKLALLEKSSQLSEMETQNEMLRSHQSSSGQHDNLVTECESAKVAASRAMAQNKQLKDQLEELETAVISLTNTKADLTNDVDMFRRKLQTSSESETSVQQELESLKAALRERDRTIESNKEQMKYYVAFAENSINEHPEAMKEKILKNEEAMARVREELEESRDQIRCLNSHNSELRNQLEVLSSRTRDSSSAETNASLRTTTTMREEDDSASSASTSSTSSTMSEDEEEEEAQSVSPVAQNNAESAAASTQANDNEGSAATAALVATKAAAAVTAAAAYSPAVDRENAPSHVAPGVAGVPVISHDVAFVKLEQKFTEAMKHIAELSAQKDELEHVNVMLQEETETVGEYITIYQHQRQQISKRMKEKELQLQTVSREREELKAKLGQLQALLTRFLGNDKDKAAATTGLVCSKQDHSQSAPTNGHGNGLAIELGEEVKEETAASTTANSNDTTSETGTRETMVEGEEDEDGGHMGHNGNPAEGGGGLVVSQASHEEIGAGAGAGTAQPALSALSKSTDDPTAKQILALLSEIGSNQMLDEKFQPWFWDHTSGEMITV